MVSPSLEDLDGEIRVPVDGPVQVWADGAIHWLGRETGDVGDDDGGGGGRGILNDFLRNNHSHKKLLKS